MASHCFAHPLADPVCRSPAGVKYAVARLGWPMKGKRRAEARGKSPLPLSTARGLRGSRLFRVRTALAYLRQSYQNSGLCLSSAAKQAGVSPWYLSRLFRLCTRRGFREHLKGVRMERAAEMLRNPTLAVKEVAWAVGYKHVSCFDRDFRARYGKPPVAFRCDAAWVRKRIVRYTH